MKLALPKGRLLKDTAALLEAAGLGLAEYDEKSRSYRPQSDEFTSLSPKVFQEKDVPIQVAVGNYDLGICGLDWVTELLSKYPSADLVELGELGYGKGGLYVAASVRAGISSLDEVDGRFERVRMVSEYPNLAEFVALQHRLRRFSVLPVWGAAEVYPPECAELVLVRAASANGLARHGLVPLAKVLASTTVLVANRNSLAEADMGGLLARLRTTRVRTRQSERLSPVGGATSESPEEHNGNAVRLALPDGHQQRHTVRFLAKAGIDIGEYDEPLKTRRPRIGLDGISVKVIRPQDMPAQVANGNFDLAVTGEDWLRDHLYRFPSSPVERMVNLGFGTVRIVAVVSERIPVHDAAELRGYALRSLLQIRVASEYVNIADKYARDNHLAGYRVIPTWGASEAFLPEDADLLIENTETGATLRKHKLRIIDDLFESSACVITHKGALSDSRKVPTIERAIEVMKRTAA